MILLCAVVFALFGGLAIYELDKVRDSLSFLVLGADSLSVYASELVRLMDKPVLTPAFVRILQKHAGEPPAENIRPEELGIYQSGITDGAAVLAQIVLEKLKETQ